MKILAIETSCDETAVAILNCTSDAENNSGNGTELSEQSVTFEVLSHALISQIEIHREFGGVFPAVAKREHAKNLVPLLGTALEEAELLHEDTQILPDEVRTQLGEMLERESDMAEAFIQFISETERPDIDAIAVTYGPGLAPALWVGVNFAQALALAWNIPLVPVNHMEGHFLVGVAKRNSETDASGNSHDLLKIENLQTPILGLLISGGHTQLMLMEQWLSYRLLGETKDDAVGEAFDKVARMMDLPYPGGPEISKLAEKDRTDSISNTNGSRANPFKLPRPMIDSHDFNFSYSGLKTAVLYALRDLKKTKPEESAELDSLEKEQLSREFEDAATDVLTSKTLRALEETQAQTLVIGGGVSANVHIQKTFTEKLAAKLPYVSLSFPPSGLTGDNAVMIGIAGFYRAQKQEFSKPGTLTADGNLSLSKQEV
jgi:N6-L-threonylcarbamoyladenine synthase